MVPKGCGRADNPADSCRALAKKEGPPFPRGLPRAIRREEAPEALPTAKGFYLTGSGPGIGIHATTASASRSISLVLHT